MMCSFDHVPLDLHMHSCHSIDGEYTCAQLAEKAKQEGLSIVALSDHNTAKGRKQWRYHCQRLGLKTFPAIEFDSLYQGRETHILGYGLRWEAEVFDQLQEKIEQLEQDAFEKKLTKLEEIYALSLDIPSLLLRCQNENPFQVMYGALLTHPQSKQISALAPYLPGGSRSENAIVNFYWDCCSYGKPGYVSVPYPDAKDVIQQIHAYGGLAVLAHPGVNFYQKPGDLDLLRQLGIDGIEVFSTYHRPEETAFFKDYALQHGCYISGGSDFHGSYKPNIAMGRFGLRQDEAVLITPLLEELSRRGCLW